MKTEPEEERTQIGRFGYGRCTPAWMQRLHNGKYLAILLTLLFIWQSFVVNGIMPVIISTLERRFGLSSSNTGLLSTIYNIAAVCTLLPLTYFADRVHKGRYIAWGMLIFSAGSLTFILPQFISEPYVTSSKNGTTVLCELRADTEVKQPLITSSLAFSMLMVGHALHGIGASPLQALHLPYLDENVNAKSLPMYITHLRAWPAIGVLSGYTIGAQILKIYGDFYRSDWKSDTDLSGNKDPRWYGAWWVGFLAGAILIVATTIPLFGFARRMPLQQEELEDHPHLAEEEDERYQADAKLVDDTKDLSFNFRDMHRILKAFFTNMPWLGLQFGHIINALVLNAMLVFLPKLVENYFNITPAKSGMLVGSVLVPCTLAGTVIGGYICGRYKLSVRGCLKIVLITHILVFFAMTVFLIKCDATPFFGENHERTAIQLRQPCNSDCHCGVSYEPICDEQTNTIFYSACYAGCKAGRDGSWSNCSCAFYINPNTNATLKDGICSRQRKVCSKLYLFLTIFGLCGILLFIQMVPLSQLNVRMIPVERRGLNVTLGILISRIFGNIPGAAVTGALIDDACMLWSQDKSKEYCIRYNVTRISHLLLYFGGALRLVAIIATYISLRTYRDCTIKYQEYNRTPTEIKDRDSATRHIDQNQRESLAMTKLK